MSKGHLRSYLLSSNDTKFTKPTDISISIIHSIKTTYAIHRTPYAFDEIGPGELNLSNDLHMHLSNNS